MKFVRVANTRRFAKYEVPWEKGNVKPFGAIYLPLNQTSLPAEIVIPAP